MSRYKVWGHPGTKKQINLIELIGGKVLIQRKFLVVVMAGFVLVTSACGPYFSRPLRNPLLINIGTSTATATATGPATSPTPSPSFVPTSTGAYFTLTRASNCHNGPGISYNVVLIMSSGETVEVIGRTSDTTWWRISRDLSVDCWVANEWGIFTGEVARVPITSSQYATKALTPLAPTKTKVGRVDAATNTALPSPAPATRTPLPPPTNTPQPPPTNTQQPPPTETTVPPTDIPTIETPIIVVPPILIPTSVPLSADPPPDQESLP